MILPPKKDDSCVLWYDFTSIKNNTVYDQSRYGNHGTIYGAQHIGRFGLHRLHFDGVDDKLRVNSITNIKPPWTFVIFFKIEEEKINNLVTKKHDGANFKYQMYAYHHGSNIQVQVHKDPDTVCLNTSFSCPPPNNNIFFAWTTDNEARRTTAFVNNEKKLDEEFYCDVIDASTPLQIGWHGDSNWYLHGNIYFVALYNRALSDAEIRELYYYLTKGIKSVIPSRFVARARR